MPAGPDKRILAHVVRDSVEIQITVSTAILDLLADVTQRFALPSHGLRRQVPLRMSWHPRGVEVGVVMAGVALHAGRTVAVGAAYDQRLVRTAGVGLQRNVTGGMTVHAARVQDDLAGFFEQRDGALPLVRDRSECRDRTQWAAGGLLCCAPIGGDGAGSCHAQDAERDAPAMSAGRHATTLLTKGRRRGRP